MSSPAAAPAAAAASSTPAAAPAAAKPTSASAKPAAAAASSSADAADAEAGEEKKEEEPVTIADAGVLNKYKEAAKIASDALALVVRSAANGVSVLDLAKLGDELIVERCSKVLANKKGVSKGVAFPTSISKNNIVGHFAPMEKDQEQPLLNTGDIVKVDLAVQIDGYCAVVAQTFAVPAQAGAAQTTPIKGRAADCYAACLVAADAALRSLKVGNKNYPISELIAKIAAEYNVTPVQGVLSHQMSRNKIDGDKSILNRLDPENKIEEISFGADEVYGIDIVMSTGEGKPKEIDNRQTTIYKRNAAVTYSLKHKTSRSIYSEVANKYASFPFSLRYLEDATKARFGIAEAKEHDMVHAYPVLHEKEGEIVCQVKFTALVTAQGTTRITGPVGGLELNPNIVQVEKKFKDYDAELQTALKALTIAPAAAAAASSSGDAAPAAAASAQALKNQKKRDAKKKKEAAEAAAAAGGAAAPAAK